MVEEIKELIRLLETDIKLSNGSLIGLLLDIICKEEEEDEDFE